MLSSLFRQLACDYSELAEAIDYRGIQVHAKEEPRSIKELKKMYRSYLPFRFTGEVEAKYSFMYPFRHLVYVTDLVRKRKLTPREQQILQEKHWVASEFGVHPDKVIIHTMWESY
ncbi:MAG: hypothetical protein AB1330_01085 [Bacillota bacterium]